MRKYFAVLLFFMMVGSKYLQAQQIDSIFFHLYTDSLKKGTYNYINVDGKTNEGRWLPLTARQVDFAASSGRFENNCLVIDKNFSEDSIIVTAILKSNLTIRKTRTIYIKKLEDNSKLPTAEEVLNEMNRPKRKNPKGS